MKLKKFFEALDEPKDIIITLPKSISWDEYQKELDAVADGSQVMRFKVNSFPKNAKEGCRCYLVHDGHIKGWMKVTGFHEGDFQCSTTGQNWTGKFIERSGPFHTTNSIPYKGFQGWRYYTQSVNEGVRETKTVKSVFKSKLHNDKAKIYLKIEDEYDEVMEQVIRFVEKYRKHIKVWYVKIESSVKGDAVKKFKDSHSLVLYLRHLAGTGVNEDSDIWGYWISPTGQQEIIFTPHGHGKALTVFDDFKDQKIGANTTAVKKGYIWINAHSKSFVVGLEPAIVNDRALIKLFKLMTSTNEFYDSFHVILGTDDDNIMKFVDVGGAVRYLKREVMNARKKKIYEATNEKGWFVGLRLTPESEDKIVQWMKENKIRNPVAKDKLHITLVLDKTRWIDNERNKKYDPPIKIDKKTYELKLLGENKDVLVLGFENRALEYLHLYLRNKHDIQWDWDSYSPHLTLSYDGGYDSTDGIALPDFDLFIDHEYTTPFDNDWNGDNN